MPADGTANLRPKPWKKGQSGNPAGLPKGYVRLSTILNRYLNAKIDVIENGRKVKKLAKDVVAMKAVRDAINDDNSASERTQARESIYSRLEGKPIQPIGAAPDTAISITISNDEDQV